MFLPWGCKFHVLIWQDFFFDDSIDGLVHNRESFFEQKIRTFERTWKVISTVQIESAYYGLDTDECDGSIRRFDGLLSGHKRRRAWSHPVPTISSGQTNQASKEIDVFDHRRHSGVRRMHHHICNRCFFHHVHMPDQHGRDGPPRPARYPTRRIAERMAADDYASRLARDAFCASTAGRPFAPRRRRARRPVLRAVHGHLPVDDVLGDPVLRAAPCAKAPGPGRWVHAATYARLVLM
jgi:hypothetical protein